MATVAPFGTGTDRSVGLPAGSCPWSGSKVSVWVVSGRGRIGKAATRGAASALL